MTLLCCRQATQDPQHSGIPGGPRDEERAHWPHQLCAQGRGHSSAACSRQWCARHYGQGKHVGCAHSQACLPAARSRTQDAHCFMLEMSRVCVEGLCLSAGSSRRTLLLPSRTSCLCMVQGLGGCVHHTCACRTCKKAQEGSQRKCSARKTLWSQSTSSQAAHLFPGRCLHEEATLVG